MYKRQFSKSRPLQFSGAQESQASSRERVTHDHVKQPLKRKRYMEKMYAAPKLESSKASASEMKGCTSCCDTLEKLIDSTEAHVERKEILWKAHGRGHCRVPCLLSVAITMLETRQVL